MKAAKLLMSAAASAFLAGTADAQFLRPPVAPPGGLASVPSPVLNGVVPPPGLGVGVGPGAQLPGQMNTIWSRLGISQEQREFCKRKICRTPAGALLGRIQAPISTLSGGIIPPFCPIVPSIAELLDPGPVGAASKAKLDRAGAEERVKAVKYLGTLDCHYWPEAEEALIGSLRGDRNECVRYEAAVALSKGCCCTCKVIVALSHVVSCSDKDGFPYEKSARVRAVAAHALDRCMASNCLSCPELPCLPGMEPEVPEKEKEKDKEKETEKEKEKPKLEQGKDKADEDKKKDDEKKKKDDEKKKKDDEKKLMAKLGDAEFPREYYTKVSRMPRDKVGEFGQRALEIGASIGYQVVGDVNARDYAAAGVNATRDGQSVGAKPTTIWELMTWKDSGAAIGNSLVAPPAAYSGVAGVPAPKSVASAPLASPGKAMPPAMLASQRTAATPVREAVPVKETLVEVPVVSLPSASKMAPRTLPQPLTVPTLNPTPMPAVAAAATPAPVVKIPIVKPTAVPAKPVAFTPMPLPVPAIAAPKAFPTVMQPTMAPRSSPIPAIVIPTAPKLPDVRTTPTISIPAANGLPPVEKLTPIAEPSSDLPPVEKFSPLK